MKQFFKNIFLFFSVLGLIFLLGMMLPVTPKSKNYMISIKPKKDSMLKSIKDPRIIFMGGSNLVFGLNSQMIKDSLQMNPINTGLAIGFGSVYMMNDILPNIKNGDYIIFALEYQLYYGNYAYGHNDLMRLLMDVEPDGFKKLELKHIPNLIKVAPDYFISKFVISNYFERTDDDIYGNKGFNEFGDSSLHWASEGVKFPIVSPIKGGFNSDFFSKLLEFNQRIKEKGAVLYIAYPGMQESSFYFIKEQINEVQKILEASELTVLGSPETYVVPDSLMFDSPYHLLKKGVDIRTNLLIIDIKNQMAKETTVREKKNNIH